MPQDKPRFTILDDDDEAPTTTTVVATSEKGPRFTILPDEPEPTTGARVKGYLQATAKNVPASALASAKDYGDLLSRTGLAPSSSGLRMAAKALGALIPNTGVGKAARAVAEPADASDTRPNLTERVTSPRESFKRDPVGMALDVGGLVGGAGRLATGAARAVGPGLRTVGLAMMPGGKLAPLTEKAIRGVAGGAVGIPVGKIGTMVTGSPVAGSAAGLYAGNAVREMIDPATVAKVQGAAARGSARTGTRLANAKIPAWLDAVLNASLARQLARAEEEPEK